MTTGLQRQPRRMISEWSRLSQMAVIGLAVVLLTWVFSFLAVSPERGDVPITLVTPPGSDIKIVMADPQRLGLRLPVGNVEAGLRFALPADARDNQYALFADHILTDRIRLLDPAGRVLGTGSSFHPRGMTAGGASAFYVFPLEAEGHGGALVYRLLVDVEAEQTVVLRVTTVERLRMLEQRLTIALALRYGALFAMMILLLALHVSTGEPASRAYVWVTLLTLLSLLQLHGYLYLLPGLERMGDAGIALMFAMRNLLVIAGVHLFLWLGQRDTPPPRLRRWVNAVCLLLLVPTVMQAMRWLPGWMMAPLGFLYMATSLLMLALAWRAIRNGIPLARSIFVTLLATVVAVFATDLYDMGLIEGGWWVNAGGTGLVIVWLGMMAVSLIRRTGDYRRQLEDAARRQQLLQRAADTDILTGLPNRASLDQHLVGRMQSGHDFSLLFVDIDRFKAINDQHGHAAGDTVLRAVAHELARSLRGDDYVARYGGEEFVVVASHTGDGEAWALAERMRERVAAIGIDWQGGHLPVTVSIGVAAPSEGNDIRELMARADAAMYAAKRNGRNRVESFTGRRADHSTATPQT